MSYSDYSFYQTNYLNGNEPLISREAFAIYANKANAYIRKCTFGNSDLYKDEDNMKKCECAVAESMCEEATTGTGITSESVGGHSVSYGDTSAVYGKQRRNILNDYLWEYHFGRKVFEA